MWICLLNNVDMFTVYVLSVYLKEYGKLNNVDMFTVYVLSVYLKDINVVNTTKIP